MVFRIAGGQGGLPASNGGGGQIITGNRTVTGGQVVDMLAGGQGIVNTGGISPYANGGNAVNGGGGGALSTAGSLSSSQH